MTKFRNKQINDLDQWLHNRRTDPKISMCLINTLKANGDESFYSSMRLMTNDAIYLSCSQVQDSIGYHNFLFGRISSHWKELQRSYLEKKYNDRRFSADAWAKHLIAKLYRIIHNIWRYRCDRVHGKDQQRISKREKKALRKEIKLQYSLGADTPTCE